MSNSDSSSLRSAPRTIFGALLLIAWVLSNSTSPTS